MEHVIQRSTIIFCRDGAIRVVRYDMPVNPELRRRLMLACLVNIVLLSAIFQACKSIAIELRQATDEQYSSRCLCSTGTDKLCTEDGKQFQSRPLLSFLDRYLLRFHSQAGQDRHVLRRLILRCGQGFFVEFGAGDGVAYSNSLFFEQQLGWTGLLFEPEQGVAQHLRANRPGAVVFEGAVCPTGQSSLNFGVSKRPGMSGAIATSEPTRRAWHDRTIQVRCYDLAEILRQRGQFHVDYLTIDTEGSEWEIIEKFPWANFSIRIVQIEQLDERRYTSQAGKKARIIRHMRSQGYQLVDGQAYTVTARDTEDLIFLLNRDASRPRNERPPHTTKVNNSSRNRLTRVRSMDGRK